MAPVIEARRLVKEYRDVRAVDGVDLVVDAGERVALLGANGAGKSTTLFMLLGLVAPDAGHVDLLGHRLPGGRSRATEGVGFAAGYVPLPDRLRVQESLSVFARLAGVADVPGAVAAGLERFGVAHLADRLGSQLSSGQRTLCGIVKATLHRPRLLVLDEPTASLDPDVAQRVRAGLERACAEDRSALLVTSHNMTDVERVCERVVFLSRGRVAADGPPGEVAARFGRDSLEEVFLHLATEEER
ncbi:MAG: ABC transporter ATP-binding protein [Actinomycetota bacterium]|nr:ABC transporter ATP-binding protein [Actinomycetota bacterium]